MASGLSNPAQPSEANLLAQALKCVLASEVIQGTIYAYRNWSSQPYCDLILAQFDADEIISIFLQIESSDSQMKVGVLGVLDNMDRELAVKLASMLNNPNESEDVLNAVRNTLRAT
ncbi:MAG: hypothetical protein H0X30_38835 [Anaerolineae bacterium]|nr:hypothetical protein [Anaerolineae bacterium]